MTHKNKIKHTRSVNKSPLELGDGAVLRAHRELLYLAYANGTSKQARRNAAVRYSKLLQVTDNKPTTHHVASSNDIAVLAQQINGRRLR